MTYKELEWKQGDQERGYSRHSGKRYWGLGPGWKQLRWGEMVKF